MVAKRVQEGKAINFTNTTGADIAGGSVIRINNLLGVVQLPCLNGRAGVIHIQGVFAVDKGSTEFNLGDYVYWNPELNQATDEDSGLYLLGICVKDAASGDSSVDTLIG